MRARYFRRRAPLVHAGLIEAEPDEHDRRKRIVALTDEGAALVKEARPRWARAQKELSRRFGTGRTDALMAELHALVGAA
jgi:DNA-binding MarR family transcriptional regulator